MAWPPGQEAVGFCRLSNTYEFLHASPLAAYPNPYTLYTPICCPKNGVHFRHQVNLAMGQCGLETVGIFGQQFSLREG